MKRQINSEAELVSAMCKGVGVESELFSAVNKKVGILYNGAYSDLYLHWITKSFWQIERDIKLGYFVYKDEVEVVELWGHDFDGEIEYKNKDWCSYYTHKQTQINQNGEIIWTETIKIK